jgi:hypothetical protein
MFNRIKLFSLGSALLLLMVTVGCKKGTFDINNPNPNVPSSVSPKFVLSAALLNSGNLMLGVNYTDFANLYMGYWAISGDYIPTFTTLTYNTTTSYYTNSWNVGYQTLQNYRYIEQLSGTDPNQSYYVAMAKIMEAFHFGRLVDMYNNIPYSDALNGGTENFPKYDDALSVYTSVMHQLDSAIAIINAAPPTAVSPGEYDIMFGGNMSMWILFANTTKLKFLMNLTQSGTGQSLIQSELSGLETSDFLGAGQDAVVNPGFTNATTAQQSPLWQDVGFAPSGAVQNNQSYYRACSYAVNFYASTNDTFRNQLFYAANVNGQIQGRAFGSQGANEHNTIISGVGPGLLQSPSMDCMILPATESLFLQAEAVQRGYLTGAAAKDLYQSAVEESFRYLGDTKAHADALIAQADDRVNFISSANPLQTIILQEWAALNTLDPVQSWDNWRRLGIPTDLPVSIYPGTTATHVPYRLLYPDTEYSYNGTNVNSEGTINNLTSKIFWMP